MGWSEMVDIRLPQGLTGTSGPICDPGPPGPGRRYSSLDGVRFGPPYGDSSERFKLWLGDFPRPPQYQKILANLEVQAGKIFFEIDNLCGKILDREEELSALNRNRQYQMELLDEIKITINLLSAQIQDVGEP